MLDRARERRRRKALDTAIQRQCGLCFVCGEQLDETVTAEHIVPQCYGGNDYYLNIGASHYQCNNDRGAAFDQSTTPLRDFSQLMLKQYLRKNKKKQEGIKKRAQDVTDTESQELAAGIARFQRQLKLELKRRREKRGHHSNY